MTEGITLATLKLKELPKTSATTQAINNLLTVAGISSWDDIYSAVKQGSEAMAKLNVERNDAVERLDKANKSNEELSRKIGELSLKASATTLPPIELKATDKIPAGKVTTKKASDIFGIKMKPDFDLPYWEWEGKHPLVPEVDEGYIFRKKELQRVLFALVTNVRAYLQGHTGSGKTTLLEQVAAKLNYPFIRINFDSEITRSDLIGRDTIFTTEDGKTESKFVDGLLPMAMQTPCIACFDEIDFTRPDVAYVMQSALEGNSLRIPEDGGRLVQPHPYYRMFGTGNTVGQGDEEGMYQGARAQSLAFLDRFSVWIPVPYLDKTQRLGLLKAKVPGLTGESYDSIERYTAEHLAAFTRGDIIQPISPRGILQVAKATLIFGNIRDAVEMTILDRCNTDDKLVIKEIIDRVFK